MLVNLKMFENWKQCLANMRCVCERVREREELLHIYLHTNRQDREIDK